jgi:release factor glutamine methyltransferase
LGTAITHQHTILAGMTRRLLGVSETAALDAQLVLAQVTGRSRSWVLAHPEVDLAAHQAAALEEAMRRLEAGEPLPYVLGEWEFYGLKFLVGPEVLIPRPETEVMIELALKWLKDHPERRFAVDVGTGSGCIAITLAVHTPGLKLLAGDLSLGSLQIARQNAFRNGVRAQVGFVCADLLPPAAQKFDLICANLPYIPSQILAELKVARWEPHLALDGGPDGLALIRRMLGLARRTVSRGGLVLLEIEASQGQMAVAAAVGEFPGCTVQSVRDLAGLDRVLQIFA